MPSFRELLAAAKSEIREVTPAEADDVGSGLAGVVDVATPDNIVILRRTDPRAADEWRLRLRRELGERLANGARVVGFTREGCYQVADPS